MRKTAIALLALLATSPLRAYEIPDENDYVSETCRINVKVSVIPDEKMENPTGRAMVTATLTNDEGNPKPDVRLTITANAGTFVCRLPEDSTAAEEVQTDCFTTRYDGIAQLYLVNIPLNTPIKVTASYVCGDNNKVSSFASMSISRGKAKHKKQVRPRVR